MPAKKSSPKPKTAANKRASGGRSASPCSAALVAEIEYATNQKKQCLSDSVDREQNDDASGSAYYKGLAIAYAQMAKRLKYLLPNAHAQTPATGASADTHTNHTNT